MSAAMAAWATPRGTVALEPASIHVWLAWCALDSPLDDETGLSSDERDRARRFIFARDRRRFVFARKTLRQVLGGYLGIDAAAVRFTYAAHGKPALANGFGAGLEFNMSHSDEAVVIAVSSAGPIGIDIEAIRSMRDRDEIARGTFAPGEVERLHALDEASRTDGFFRCWTRKEAFVKALGDGLNHSLDRFEVSLGPDEPARLLHIDGDAHCAARWMMAALPPLPGFASALALHGTAGVSCFQFQEEPAAAVVAAAGERCMA